MCYSQEPVCSHFSTLPSLGFILHCFLPGGGIISAQDSSWHIVHLALEARGSLPTSFANPGENLPPPQCSSKISKMDSEALSEGHPSTPEPVTGPEESTLLSWAGLGHGSTTRRLSRLEEGKEGIPQRKNRRRAIIMRGVWELGGRNCRGEQ